MSGCPHCGIDVHTHVVPEHFPAYAGRGGEAAWPSMVPAQACHRHVMIAGKVYRTVSDRAWDGALRVGDMDDMRLRSQVLSPMPELLSYWMPLADAQPLLRYLNEEIAALVAAHPGRFFGLGAVPLQDVDAAIRELEYVMGPLGLAGVEIAGNVNGVTLGDARLAPFWAAVDSLGAAVFVHPLRPAGKDRLVGPKALEQLLAFPSETGLAAASLLTGGVMERHPGLRIAFSHGGGTLSALLPRLQHGWNRMPAVKETMTRSPLELARRFFVDSLVYDTRTLAGLIDLLGHTQILLGSDYPFQIREHDPVGSVERLELTAEVRDRLLWKNALQWLGTDSLHAA